MSKQVPAAGMVLAAGAGTRYGMPKVLAAEGDWLDAAVSALRGGGCDPVLVVLGAALVDVPAPARAIHVADWSTGMSASVRAGLSAAEEEGADIAVISLVDTPDIGADVVARVLAAATGSGLARAVYGGRPGHPVAVGRAHWPALRAALTGDRGARDFLAGRPDVVTVECGDLASGADIDRR